LRFKNANKEENKLNETRESQNWSLGFDYMYKLANSNGLEHEKTLIHAAQYNVGLAYYQGYCVKKSYSEAEKWWLKAADDGNPLACVSAMTALAFFYSNKSDKEYFDLKKAYFWHNEACGNGSLESQGFS
jgi:TPR repeat protein